MTEEIYTLIQIAAKIFKQHYGTYPQSIGMDIARCRQVGRHHYSFMQEGPKPRWQGWDDLEQQRMLPDSAEVVHVEIVPASVKEDELLCRSGETMARMTVWSTSRGYHTIIWE